MTRRREPEQQATQPEQQAEVPAVTVDPPQTGPTGRLVSVKLSHFWDDRDGKTHKPGQTVQVSADKAKSLVWGGYGRLVEESESP